MSFSKNTQSRFYDRHGSCPCMCPWVVIFNRSWLRQNARDFADDISKCIFLTENVWIPTKISTNFVPKDAVHIIAALVQIMSRRRKSDKPLCELILTRFTDAYNPLQGRRVNSSHRFVPLLVLLIVNSDPYFKSEINGLVFSRSNTSSCHLASSILCMETFINYMSTHGLCYKCIRVSRTIFDWAAS